MATMDSTTKPLTQGNGITRNRTWVLSVAVGASPQREVLTTILLSRIVESRVWICGFWAGVGQGFFSVGIHLGSGCGTFVIGVGRSGLIAILIHLVEWGHCLVEDYLLRGKRG